MSSTEILIVSLTVTSSMGLLTYLSDSRTSGHEAYDAQKQDLTERAKAFTKAKKSLIKLINQHLNSTELKGKSIKVLSSKKRLRPSRPSANANANGEADGNGSNNANDAHTNAFNSTRLMSRPGTAAGNYAGVSSVIEKSFTLSSMF